MCERTSAARFNTWRIDRSANFSDFFSSSRDWAAAEHCGPFGLSLAYSVGPFFQSFSIFLVSVRFWWCALQYAHTITKAHTESWEPIELSFEHFFLQKTFSTSSIFFWLFSCIYRQLNTIHTRLKAVCENWFVGSGAVPPPQTPLALFFKCALAHRWVLWWVSARAIEGMRGEEERSLLLAFALPWGVCGKITSGENF